MLDTIRLIPELRTNYKISLICFIVFLKLIVAQPFISDVMPVNSIVSAFEKFEIATNFSTLSNTNPYEPYDINTKCKYHSPTIQYFVVNGFWDGFNKRGGNGIYYLHFEGSIDNRAQKISLIK